MADPNEEPQGVTPGEDPPADPPAAAEEDDDLASILSDLFTNEDTPPESGKGQEGVTPPPDSTPPSSSDEPAAPSAPGPGLDLQDPNTQAVLRQWYREQKAAEERQQAEEAGLQEVVKWVQEGDYTKLGEAVAEELQEAATRKEVGGEVLGEFLTNTYARLFSDPVMKDLTPEEQAQINPAKFKGGDAEYVVFLNDFIAGKKARTTTDEQIEQKVQERLKALANERRGGKLTSPSPNSGLPPSMPGETPPDDDGKTGADLIKEGLAEAYEESASRRRW